MPPRPPARSSRARYRPIGGSARRYADTVTGEAISYHEFYRRTHGGASRSDVTARRQGFSNRSERERFRRSYEIQQARRRVPNVQFFTQTAASRNLRRRRLAESWAEYRIAGGDDNVVLLSRPNRLRRWRVNTTWAMQQPEFQELEQRLAAFSQRDRQFHDVDKSPGGEYAQVLEELGRRPPDYAWNVGDSPPGTRQAMLDVLMRGEGSEESYLRGLRFLSQTEQSSEFVRLENGQLRPV